jgi:hypothetical protein
MPTKKDNEIEAAASASPMLRRRWHSMAVFHCALMESVRSTVGKIAKKSLTNERNFFQVILENTVFRIILARSRAENECRRTRM